MPSFWLHKWPRNPKSDPSGMGITVWGCCGKPMDSISMCSNTLHKSNVDAWDAVWGGYQPQPWCNGIILNPQETPKYVPSSVGITVWGYSCMPWTECQCAQTLCICLMWMWEAVWVGCQPEPWANDIILTPQVTQNPKIRPKICGYIYLRKFEVAVSINHNVMTSFWLHSDPNPKIWAK
jgi:hypothetical protein